MQIRIASPTSKDAPALSAIHCDSWKAAYRGIIPQNYLDELRADNWVSHFKNWIASGEMAMKALWQDNLLAACIAYGPAREEQGKGVAEIISLYVRPQQFGMGYGGLLLQDSMQLMRLGGYHSCMLWTFRDNFSARCFYEKHGFVFDGEEKPVEIGGEKPVGVKYTIAL